jgi:polynucleotide 5'-hydroxyl-kinase GRC3/NOL9
MIKKFKKGEIYIIKGDIEFKVIEGEIEIVGKRFVKGESGFIPVGKSLPFEFLDNSEIEFKDYSENKLEKVEFRTIPKEWDEIIEAIKTRNYRKVIVVGAMDTGKSFFSTYVANKLFYSGKKVGVIDTDLGQSDIGPPTTIGFSLLNYPTLFLQNSPLTSFEFIGAHSPSLHLVPMLVGFNKIVKKALQVSDVIIVNTSGFIYGDVARILKNAKFDILEPDMIVLIQNSNECEHLIKSIVETEKIFRLKVSKKASETSKSEREKLRNLASQKYFKNSKEITLKFEQFLTERCYFKTGVEFKIPDSLKKNVIYIEKFPAYEGTLVVSKKFLTKDEIIILNNNGFLNIKNFIAGNEKGIILGLLDEKRETLALGITKFIDFENKFIKIITPYSGDVERIKIIQFGSIRYTEEGKENGFIEPGIF